MSSFFPRRNHEIESKAIYDNSSQQSGLRERPYRHAMNHQGRFVFPDFRMHERAKTPANKRVLKIKIGMVNLAGNMRRLVRLDTRSAPA